MAVSAADRHFTLRQVTAALDASFPCNLIYKKSIDRRGHQVLVPFLLLELSETDYQALQDAAGANG